MSKLLTDLKGKVFGKLTVICYSGFKNYETRSGRKNYWKCRCICGKEKKVFHQSLIRGYSKTCGSRLCRNNGTRSFIDLTGKVFGKLIVVKLLDNKNNLQWLCRCACGRETKVRTTYLKNEIIVSCGCSKLSHENDYLFSNYKRLVYDAENRGLECNISIEIFSRIVKSVCNYCGCQPSQPVSRGRKFRKDFQCFVNGIDRLNNQLGYITENVVPCCRSCNVAKSVKTEKQFIMWVRQVHEYTKNKVIN